MWKRAWVSGGSRFQGTQYERMGTVRAGAGEHYGRECIADGRGMRECLPGRVYGAAGMAGIGVACGEDSKGMSVCLAGRVERVQQARRGRKVKEDEEEKLGERNGV